MARSGGRRHRGLPAHPSDNRNQRTIDRSGVIPRVRGRANDPHTPSDIARLFNACIDGVRGVHFSLHVCFGSFRKLPYAKKTYARYFPDLLEDRADHEPRGRRPDGSRRTVTSDPATGL